MKYLLYNPLSKNGNCKHKVESLKNDSSYVIINVLEKEEYLKILNSLTKDDELYLYGGDGTLNHFVNDVKGMEIPCNIYFNTSGTGNDFYTDVKKEGDSDLILINDYIKDLPRVIINDDKEYLFINGVGFGIDGYCCEEGDRLQKLSDKPVNYAGIAIKGLLFKFPARSGKVTVDGETIEYKRIWICPTMKGRFYGGGMMVTPNQNRLEKGVVSHACFHTSGKIKTLMVFPKLFEGTHLKHTDCFTVRTGKHIIVEFDRPTPLQIDGETFSNVTKYEVFA